MKMDNVIFVNIENSIDKSVTTHAIIDHGNEEFTSMLKSTYDAMQAEQSTPMVTDEAASL
jgi:hypothetical protein